MAMGHVNERFMISHAGLRIDFDERAWHTLHQIYRKFHNSLYELDAHATDI